MNTLEEWTAAVCAELGLDPASADVATVLDLARDAAHGVARPAAPLTAYLVGVAVGQGMTLPGGSPRSRRTGPPTRQAIRRAPDRHDYRTLTASVIAR